ncbi:hypothetical protein [Brevibacillus fortis]
MTQTGGIKTIKLEMNVGGNPFVVHTAVLWDENEAILVDIVVKERND